MHTERVGILDIEASNLKATFGIVFSYAIKLLDGKILGRAVTPKEIRSGAYDKPLLQECIRDILSLDKVVGYFSSRYDIPFLRSRCLHFGLPFPLYKEVYTLDLYDIVKRKLCLHRNRLQTACEFLGIQSKGHPIKSNVWFGAMGGQKEALDYIWTHNIEDVESTEALYKRMVEYGAPTKSSI